MGILTNSGSDYDKWNYHDPQKEEYLPTIIGTIVEFAEIQARNFSTGQPEYWPPNQQGISNPKLSLRVMIQGKTGKRLPWVIAPGSLGFEALMNAFKITDSTQLPTIAGGKQVKISTSNDKNTWIVRQQKNGGSSGAARPWFVEFMGDGLVPYEGTIEFGGQTSQAATLQPTQEELSAPAVEF